MLGWGRTGSTMTTDIVAFARQKFELRAVPIVPEIRLYTAHSGSGLRRLLEAGLAPGDDNPSPPYWAYPWAGGAVLARYLLDHPETVRTRRVTDLGSGSGLVAIAAALAGASSVTAIEIDRHGIAIIPLNAEANGVTVTPEQADILDGPAPDTDVLLAGDIFYAPVLAARVLPFLQRCRSAGVMVLIGDPHRAPLPQAHLMPLASYRVSDFGLGAAGEAPGAVFALR